MKKTRKHKPDRYKSKMFSTFLGSMHNTQISNMGAVHSNIKSTEISGHSTEIRIFQTFCFINGVIWTQAYQFYNHQ
jgi:hypothetical protein